MILNAFGQSVTATKTTIRISSARMAKFAAYADDVFRQLSLTVICPKCHETPIGNNAATDSQWRLECSCTVRILTNPDVRSMATNVRH